MNNSSDILRGRKKEKRPSRGDIHSQSLLKCESILHLNSKNFGKFSDFSVTQFLNYKVSFYIFSFFEGEKLGMMTDKE